MQGWTRIAKAVNADSRVANRVIYDVLNEPDAFGLKFEPKGGKPGMRDLYLKSFDAIYAVNPGGAKYIVWQARSLCRVGGGHLFVLHCAGIENVCRVILIRCAPELCRTTAVRFGLQHPS